MDKFLRRHAAYSKISSFLCRKRTASVLQLPDHTQIDMQPVGLLWTSDQLVAEAAAYKNTKNIREEIPFTQRDSNQQSQQASGRRHTPQTTRSPESAFQLSYCESYSSYQAHSRNLKIHLNAHKIYEFNPKVINTRRFICIISGKLRRWVFIQRSLSSAYRRN